MFDISALADLGQHFSSQEDVAELKETLATVQNDLALIKGFLVQQFGSEFSSVLNNGVQKNEAVGNRKFVDDLLKVKISSAAAVAHRSSPSTSEPKASAKEVSSQQQRPRPPPLQRFSRVTSSDEGNSLLGKNISNSHNFLSSGKPEKFHRNFLSISKLKGSSSSSTSGGSTSLKRGIAQLTASNDRIVKRERENVDSGSGTSGVSLYKMPRLKTQPVHKVEATYDDNEEDDEGYNLSENAYAAVEVTEDDSYEVTGEEDLDYAAYDETGDYQEGDYEDYMANEQDEDGAMYEDDYSMEGLQMIDANGSAVDMMSNQGLSVQLINGRRNANAAVKKTQKRRLSLPATGGGMSDASFASGSGGGDNFLKKCKVCHEEVPSFSLFNHVVGVHYNGEVPTCTICKKTFTYKQGLISHMRYHDAEKYDKACSFCGKKFIRRSDVIIHERRLHTGERPFACPVPECNQGFVRRYCLLTHIKTNHGEPYVSQFAGGGDTR